MPLFDADMATMYESTSRLLVWILDQGLLSSRPDLVLLYYPSRYSFFHFVARLHRQLQDGPPPGTSLRASWDTLDRKSTTAETQAMADVAAKGRNTHAASESSMSPGVSASASSKVLGEDAAVQVKDSGVEDDAAATEADAASTNHPDSSLTNSLTDTMAGDPSAAAAASEKDAQYIASAAASPTRDAEAASIEDVTAAAAAGDPTRVRLSESLAAGTLMRVRDSLQTALEGNVTDELLRSMRRNRSPHEPQPQQPPQHRWWSLQHLRMKATRVPGTELAWWDDFLGAADSPPSPGDRVYSTSLALSALVDIWGETSPPAHSDTPSGQGPAGETDSGSNISAVGSSRDSVSGSAGGSSGGSGDGGSGSSSGGRGSSGGGGSGGSAVDSGSSSESTQDGGGESRSIVQSSTVRWVPDLPPAVLHAVSAAFQFLLLNSTDSLPQEGPFFSASVKSLAAGIPQRYPINHICSLQGDACFTCEQARKGGWGRELVVSV